MEKNFSQFCEEFLRLTENNTPMVVVTQVGHRGSSPNETGARMIVNKNGEILWGTVGGGKIEAHCLKLAVEFLNSKEHVENQSHTWNLQKDIGMTCGGEVTMFFEVHRPQDRWEIAVFGAGHIISQELVRVLLRIDCHLTVADQREEWLAKLPESKRLKKICTNDLAAVVDTLSENTFIASMTMGHASDVPVLLRALSERKFPFVGVIGSVAKRNRIEKDLLEKGIAPERVKELHCPMGEEFGRNAPAEIALSVTAQLLRVRDHLSDTSSLTTSR
jgi:xanthine dehydrogenase accessory factor